MTRRLMKSIEILRSRQPSIANIAAKPSPLRNLGCGVVRRMAFSFTAANAAAKSRGILVCGMKRSERKSSRKSWLLAMRPGGSKCANPAKNKSLSRSFGHAKATGNTPIAGNASARGTRQGATHVGGGRSLPKSIRWGPFNSLEK